MTKPANNNQNKVSFGKRSEKRFQRFKDFNEFYTKAKEIFEPYKNKGERERFFEAYNMLCVVPGSRAGANESNIVDVFWGSCIFDKEESSSSRKKTFHLKSESGATLFFIKNDNGYVSIHLYPAHTETMHPIEDFIIWREQIDPSKLLKKCFQYRCWRVFMAYMEVTSLNGDPTIAQRLQVWYLRKFKCTFEDKKQVPVKFMTYTKKVGTWILTVAFSGLAIFLLQLWLQQNPSEHENVKEIKESTVRTIYVLDSLKQIVVEIKKNQDSLIKTQRQTISAPPTGQEEMIE